MKRLAVFMLMTLSVLSNFACNPVESKPNDQKDNLEITNKIDVYYFHFTRRCKTCNAVESITKETIREYFSERVKSGKITFKSINMDEESGKKFAEKLEISGQTLLFVSDSEKINLTNDAFMYAKNQPDKLKEKVKAAIDKLL